MSSRPAPNRKPYLEWVSADGADPSVHFMISEKGGSRINGKDWRTAREAGRVLGWVVLLGALATGRSGSSAYGSTSHWLASKSEDREFMRWKQVRKVDVDEKKGAISLYDSQGTQMRLCCTPVTFESALRLVREHVTV